MLITLVDVANELDGLQLRHKELVESMYTGFSWTYLGEKSIGEHRAAEPRSNDG